MLIASMLEELAEERAAARRAIRQLTAMIDGMPAAGTVPYRDFGTPRELERLLADGSVE